MTIDFAKWLSEFRGLMAPFENKLRAISERDMRHQIESGNTISTLTEEGQQAANQVQARMGRTIADFHEPRTAAIAKRHIELQDPVERLAGELAAAVRELDAFEGQTNDFLRRTQGRAIRTVAKRDLALMLEDYVAQFQRGREQTNQKPKTLLRRVLERPTFVDLMN